MLVGGIPAWKGLRAKILDFGIAKLLPDGATEQERKDFKTRTGTLIGTPTYMSPEQCRASGPPDDRTDVYSLGVIFYELCDGEPPFVSDSAGELFALQMFGTPPQIKDRVPSIDPKLATLLQSLLEKSRATVRAWPSSCGSWRGCHRRVLATVRCRRVQRRDASRAGATKAVTRGVE